MKIVRNCLVAIALVTSIFSVQAFGFSLISPAYAGDSSDSLIKQVGSKIGQSYDNSNKALSIIGDVIKTVLGVLGIVFLILLIYAGFQWMNARGDDKQVQTAQGIITTAVIGLIIVLSAYAITYFVVDKAQTVTGINTTISPTN